MEEKMMTVEEFINFYNSIERKATAWSAIRLQTYIPFKLKADTALNVISDNFSPSNGQLIKNTPVLYVLNRMCAITVYCPGLLLSDTNALHDYDLLNESGVLNAILEAIGDDLKEFDTIFNMTYRDFEENINSPHAYFNRILSIGTKLLGDKTDAILKYLESDEVKTMMSMLSNTDDGK